MTRNVRFYRSLMPAKRPLVITALGRVSDPCFRVLGLRQTPTDPYTVGKSAVGSFQHCTRPQHTHAQTREKRIDAHTFLRVGWPHIVAQGRRAAAHTRLLMRTVEKSAPTASPEYADVAQRMTLARVVKVLPQRMRALALARQRLPAPAPDAPRTYPWSSVQPFAAPACAAQPPRRCIQARRAKQPHMSRAQTHERDGTRTP